MNNPVNNNNSGTVQSSFPEAFNKFKEFLENIAHKLGDFIKSHEKEIGDEVAKDVFAVLKVYLKEKINEYLELGEAEGKDLIDKLIGKVGSLLGLSPEEIQNFKNLVNDAIDKNEGLLEQVIDKFLDSKFEQIAQQIGNKAQDFLDLIANWLERL